MFCANRAELKLSAWGDSTAKPVVPILYDAQLITMHGDKMLFKGFKRSENGAEYAQEWSVQVGQ